MKTACIKIYMLICTAAQERGANTFSDEMAVYVLLALGDVVDCSLILGVELELQFLNHISLFSGPLSGSDKPRIPLFLLINVKMPTIVGI